MSPAEPPDSGEPTEAEYRQAAEACIELFESGTTHTVAVAKRQRFLAIHGLVAVTFQQTKAALLLIDNGLAAASAPNVRSAFEHAIIIQWLHNNREAAIEDFINKTLGKTKVVVEKGQKLGWEIPQDVYDELTRDAPPVNDARIGHFDQICREFDPTERLYLYYRGLSSQTHPTLENAAQYMTGTPEQPELLVRSRMQNSYHLIWGCAFSSILALACREDLVRTKPNKAKVNRIAEAVGIVPLPTLRQATRQPRQRKRGRG